MKEVTLGKNYFTSANSVLEDLDKGKNSQDMRKVIQEKNHIFALLVTKPFMIQMTLRNMKDLFILEKNHFNAKPVVKHFLYQVTS